VTTLLSRIGYIEPMMPALADAAPEGDQWIHELKYDGYRTQLALSGGERRAYTRRGHDWSHLYAPILDASGALPCRSALIEGEVIIQDRQGLSDFRALRSALAKRRPRGLVFVAFDLLHLDGAELRREPIEVRRERLRDLLGPNQASSILQYSDHVTGGGRDFFKAAEAMGAEGIVSKRLGSRYRSGPTKAWLKTKSFMTGEYVVIGTSTGDRAPVALLARESEDHRLEYVGAAMVTFSGEEREIFWRANERLKTKRPALHMEPRPETSWLKPEMRVNVRHLRGEEMLRHATVKSIAYLPPEHGKAPLPSPAGQARPSGAKAAGKRSSEPVHKLGSGSVPPPELLIDYYRKLGPLMLPFLAERPLNLFRCPPHAGGECVFQRNRMHPPRPEGFFPPPIRDIPIAQKNGRTERYLYVDDIEGLIACVRAETVEFHGWGSRVADVERPDRIAFDLDPDEGLGFAPVMRAGLDLRRHLAAIGLESFALLTGGKGIHVVVPLTPAAQWPEVREFARAFCAALAGAEPERFTVALPKAQRKGRIFLDYLRNQRTATAIMPYSVRARPGAPVAAPVRWEEMETIDDPRRFTAADAGLLLKRARRLSGWGKAEQVLPRL
jgi:bifunctional non-homologous end joining protein LigD